MAGYELIFGVGFEQMLKASAAERVTARDPMMM